MAIPGNEFHLNYGEVPVVPLGERNHPAFFIRDLTGYSIPVQSLSGMASERIGGHYVESIIKTIFASRGGSVDKNEDSFLLSDPGNGEPEGGTLRIMRFEPRAGIEVSPEQAAEIGSMAVEVIDGLIVVEGEDSAKNPHPISQFSRSMSFHALPEEYIGLYSSQR